MTDAAVITAEIARLSASTRTPCNTAALLARIAELEAELTVTDKLLKERNRVMAAIPACEAHGGQCAPHALKWIDGILARIAELEAENELLRSDVDSLLNGEFTEEDWERYRDALPA